MASVVMDEGPAEETIYGNDDFDTCMAWLMAKVKRPGDSEHPLEVRLRRYARTSEAFADRTSLRPPLGSLLGMLQRDLIHHGFASYLAMLEKAMNTDMDMDIDNLATTLASALLAATPVIVKASLTPPPAQHPIGTVTRGWAAVRNHLHMYVPTDLVDLYAERIAASSKEDSEDAGFDLALPHDVEVPAQARGHVINLRIIAYNVTSEGEPMALDMRVRSSTGKRTPLILANSPALLDRGYRGEIQAIVHNLSDEPYRATRGTRLFQLSAHDNRPFTLHQVASVDVNSTERGAKGLGSTGV